MSSDPQRFVSQAVESLPPSGIREFFGIVAKRPQAISLGIGEPDFVTPWHIREASIYALEQGKTSYTDNRGLQQLRREIRRYLNRTFQLDYDAEDEILVAVGVSEALDLCMRAILNPGDKVLYHQPCYVSYHPGISLAYGIPVPVGVSEKDAFVLNPDRLKEAWEPGCKALLLNFPTNPTGGVARKADLEKIAAFAVEKDLLVVADEIYAELTYEGEHISIATLPGMQERTVFLHGFSKAFAMTGYRIGYACGPAPIIAAMTRVHQYSMLCAPILSQEAAIEALRNGEPEVERMKTAYRRRRDFVVRRLNEMGLDCLCPEATFYVFPSIKRTGMTSDQFARQLLEAQDVAVVPGSAFGPNGEGFIRASFSTSYDNLILAMDRMEHFVEGLRTS
jgi:aminotransferase